MARWEKISVNSLYSVSDDGQVRNDKTGRILKPSLNSCGYLYVQLPVDGKLHLSLIHRLVCKAFVDNKDGKPQVDHIDGNKLNNTAENLRWVSVSENRTAYGNEQRAKNRMRAVLGINENNEQVIFESRKAVAAHFNCHPAKVKYGYRYTRSAKKGWIFYKVEDIV
jgi:hypothetical protein